MASPGVSMLTIVNMQEVLLQVSLPQDKVFQVKPGTSVEVFVETDHLHRKVYPVAPPK